MNCIAEAALGSRQPRQWIDDNVVLWIKFAYSASSPFCLASDVRSSSLKDLDDGASTDRLSRFIVVHSP